MYFYGLTGSAVGYRSIVPGLKPRSSYVRRVFHLSLRSITSGGRSAHLAYPVHKSGRKTATFYIYMYLHNHTLTALLDIFRPFVLRIFFSSLAVK